MTALAENKATAHAAYRPRRRLTDSQAAIVFLAPATLLAGVFMLYPILNTVVMSLFRVDQFGQFKSFRWFGNYVALFADGNFLAALWRTIVWTLGVVVITTVLSLLLAVILNRRFRGRAIARGLLLLPWATGLVVVGLLWRWMSQADFGAINHLLAGIGINARLEWLADPHLSFPLMVGIAIWASVPPTTLMLMAGLQSIDRDFYEAAALDGARGWFVFWDFTLPLLRPVLAVSILLNVVFVFNSFPIIWTMTEGGPAGATDTLVTYLYKLGFRLYNVGGAAAVSMVIFVILLAFAVIHTRLTWKNVLK
jgi:multiple sugar transport system permease protein